MFDIAKFTEKNWLSHDMFLLLCGGHWWDRIADFSVQLHLPQAALKSRTCNFILCLRNEGQIGLLVE